MSANSLGSANSEADEHFMRIALQLAQRGSGHVEPNPMVGCVIVRDGAAIGQGFHRRFGGPHAEIEALQSIDAGDATGATAYVSLEPCCHHGKTPPCTDALIKAGIARVVFAMRDPFPKVDGGGLLQLEQAGVQTAVDVLASEAASLNAPYLKRVRTGCPWVIAKWAMSADGHIATASGESQWITGPAARAEVHRLRSRVDAIVVGMGTVVADDPMLTARLEGESPPRVANRIVFCRQRVPALDSKLVQSATSTPLTLITGNRVPPDARAPLAAKGVNLVDANTDDPVEMVRFAMRWMGEQEMTNVMLEGGPELLASFLAADQLDEYHVYLGPKVIGGQAAPGPIGGDGVAKLSGAMALERVSISHFDHDVRVVYRTIRS